MYFFIIPNNQHLNNIMKSDLTLTDDEQILYGIVFNPNFDQQTKVDRIFDIFIRPHVKKEVNSIIPTIKQKTQIKLSFKKSKRSRKPNK